MFLEKAPDVQSVNQLTIMRAKPNQQIQGVITGSAIRAIVHWYRSKSLPCMKAALNRCPLCDLGVAQRYYAYWSVRGKKGKAAMVELTATAEAEMMDHFLHLPEESVLLVSVYRTPGKRNGPVHVNAEYRTVSPEERVQLVRCDLDQDLMKRSLVRLWNLPEWPTGMPENAYDEIIEKHMQEVIRGNI
jgi:hypothetical protein